MGSPSRVCFTFNVPLVAFGGDKALRLNGLFLRKPGDRIAGLFLCENADKEAEKVEKRVLRLEPGVDQHFS